MTKRLADKAIRYTMMYFKKDKSPSEVATKIGVTPRHVWRLWAEFCLTGSAHVHKTPGVLLACYSSLTLGFEL